MPAAVGRRDAVKAFTDTDKTKPHAQKIAQMQK